jgi:hypothetical protein
VHIEEFWHRMVVDNQDDRYSNMVRSQVEECEDRLSNDIAIVRVYFGTHFLTKLKDDVRFTLSGKVASFGTNYRRVSSTEHCPCVRKKILFGVKMGIHYATQNYNC